eukprot:3586873-Rhodomonas_salina.2
MLRARYAISSTDTGYAATRRPTLYAVVGRIRPAPPTGSNRPMLLRAPYAMPGTDVLPAGSNLPMLLRARFAMSGTEVDYAAMPCAGLSYAMLLRCHMLCYAATGL